MPRTNPMHDYHPTGGFAACMPNILTEELLQAQQMALQHQIQNYMELMHSCGIKDGLLGPIKAEASEGAHEVQSKAAAAQMFQVGISSGASLVYRLVFMKAF